MSAPSPTLHALLPLCGWNDVNAPSISYQSRCRWILLQFIAYLLHRMQSQLLFYSLNMENNIKCHRVPASEDAFWSNITDDSGWTEGGLLSPCGSLSPGTSCQLSFLNRPLLTSSNQDWTRVGVKCIRMLFSDAISPHIPFMTSMQRRSVINYIVDGFFFNS